MTMLNLTIIYRSCDKVDCFSGQPRMKPKQEVIKRCFKSLITSLYNQDSTKVNEKLIIVDDSSSKETREFLSNTVEGKIKSNIILHENLGNSGSLKQCYNEADKLPDDHLIFFVEDDYLFDQDCIGEMLYLYQKTGPNSRYILHPVDYPDRYRDIYECQIILGRTRHWRTIKHTTGTFMVPKKVFAEYRDYYEKFTEYGVTPGINEDNSINLVYSEVPCLSPLPSLAHHFQYESTLSHFLDWKELWEENKC